MPKGKKGFQPGHQLGGVSHHERKLHNKSHCFKPYADQVEAMLEVEGLPEKLRSALDQIIKDADL
jgi:hypothetical protein